MVKTTAYISGPGTRVRRIGRRCTRQAETRFTRRCRCLRRGQQSGEGGDFRILPEIGHSRRLNRRRLRCGTRQCPRLGSPARPVSVAFFRTVWPNARPHAGHRR